MTDQRSSSWRRLGSLLIVTAFIALGCSSGDDATTAEPEETTGETEGQDGGAADDQGEAGDTATFEDDAGDCVNSETGDAVPECAAPGIDIRSVTFSEGSVRVTFAFADPGRPSLGDQWRAFLAMDLDNDPATGLQRLFKLNDETVGSDLDVDAVPAPDGSGNVTVTVTAWAPNAQVLGTFGATEGATATWTDDTTLEILIPDAALQAAVGGGSTAGASGGGQALGRAPIVHGGFAKDIDALLYACMELTDRRAQKDCIRARVMVPGRWYDRNADGDGDDD